MKIVDLFELQPGGRYRHNKTAVVYTLTAVKQLTVDSFRVTLADAGGRSFNVSPPILENLYTPVDRNGNEFEPDAEPEPGIPSARIPIGTVTIDGPDGGPADPSPELNFKRSGRPTKPTIEIRSYFGESKKYGPRKKAE